MWPGGNKKKPRTDLRPQRNYDRKHIALVPLLLLLLLLLLFLLFLLSWWWYKYHVQGRPKAKAQAGTNCFIVYIKLQYNSCMLMSRTDL